MIAFSTIISILTTLGTLFLAVLVLSKKPIDSTAKSFTTMILGGALWIFFVFMADNAFDYESALWWTRLAIVGPILIAPALLYLSFSFPSRLVILVSWKRFLIFLPPAILLSLIPTSFNVVEVSLEQWGTGFTPGPLYQILILYFLLYFIASSYFFSRSYRTGNRLERAQIIYVGLGLFLAFLIGITTNLVLPLLGQTQSSVLGPAFSIIAFALFTSYAIFKHHLLEVKVVAAEVLVFGLLIILTIETLLSSSVWSLIFRFVLLGIFGAMGYLLVRSVLNEVKQRQELQQAYTKLKELDEAKTEFISIASHQLRTPLAAIKGYISMLLEGTYGKLGLKQKKPMESVYGSNERLIRLVNDLLNISRIESGKVQMEWEKAKVEDVVKSVVEELQIKAKEKKLKLVLSKPKLPLPSFRFDPQKVRNTVLNIIDNAIRYTSKGSITVSVTAKPENRNLATRSVVISVKDTGEGMAKEEIEHLFESFSRGKAGSKMWTEGAGLGLYIAKQFVSMHKGRIKAESPGKGKGSTFTVELPVQ
ncbi:MAG: ATP-binding protein [bacterium]|nr:ATP-binding protein [bacterium]